MTIRRINYMPKTLCSGAHRLLASTWLALVLFIALLSVQWLRSLAVNEGITLDLCTFTGTAFGELNVESQSGSIKMELSLLKRPIKFKNQGFLRYWHVRKIHGGSRAKSLIAGFGAKSERDSGIWVDQNLLRVDDGSPGGSGDTLEGSSYAVTVPYFFLVCVGLLLLFVGSWRRIKRANEGK